MPDRDDAETRAFWDRVAPDWRIQVGDEGDDNRRLHSDPVLWAFAGDVAGRTVLDAGCGTGYLSKKLHDRGARVIGVDFAPRMIDLARARYPGIDFRVDSCAALATVGADAVDLLVSNYVLMDLPDLDGAVGAFFRVLKPAGTAVLVFSHPCFPQGRAATAEDDEAVTYHWDTSYFAPGKRVDPPWGHFTSDFIWFHRPLSDYWKAFVGAGFQVVGFEEPRLTADRAGLAGSARQLRRGRSRPYSVVFRLQKPGPA